MPSDSQQQASSLDAKHEQTKLSAQQLNGCAVNLILLPAMHDIASIPCDTR
jgi:hypothetical protein